MSTDPTIQRSTKDVLSQHRSAFLSLAQSHLKQRPLRVLLTSAIWQWLYEYLRTLTLPRRDFPKQPPGARPGVDEIPDACKIALAADWGTGTQAAADVADQINRSQPEYTIHLGDVYYSGTSEEFAAYFLPGWPRGTRRTFALNANHEMYSGGQGYFGTALPALGQPASYFALENQHWIILGLDTGYYARIFPALEFLLKNWIRLHDDIKTWLATIIFKKGDDRGVIVLTHHQWFSSFDTEYPTIGKDLTPYLDRVYLWLWGHEHRLAGYGPFSLAGPRVRARCIGHGGMPIELGAPVKRDRNLLFVDQRLHDTVPGQRLGFCGYVLLHLNGPHLRAEYRDQAGTLLLTEEWTRGTKQPRVTGSAHLTVQPGRTWEDL